MIVYRISRAEHVRDLSGAGAQEFGGRWNSPGKPMLYTASSRSLARLEILAHSPLLPVEMVIVSLELPSRARILRMARTDLPDGWDLVPPSVVSQSLGDRFLQSRLLLGLEVPSVLEPEEMNILINPLHPSAGLIEIVHVEPIDFDSRLK
jgi:RES domain-containing protein